MTSRTFTTRIRMGASRFEFSTSGLIVDLNALPYRDGTVGPARSGHLAQVAQAVCSIHGIGPREIITFKAKRKPRRKEGWGGLTRRQQHTNIPPAAVVVRVPVHMPMM